MTENKKTHEVIDIKAQIKFNPMGLSREKLHDAPEMRVALMCMKPGQEHKVHTAPLRLMMYCVQGKGTIIVGDERIVAQAMTAVLCDPMVPHGFVADKGEEFVIMAVVTPVDMDDYNDAS